MVRNLLILIVYLSLHILIQNLYQRDNFCPIHSPTQLKGNFSSPNMNDTNFANNPQPRTVRQQNCQKWAYRWFKWWNQKMKDMLKVITFLVGFYVSTMTGRWWEQVKGIPTPASINLQLGNVVMMTPKEALNFKKKIMRYVHLRLAKDL